MTKHFLIGTAAAAAIALASGGFAQTRASGGTANYWMSAETMSGFAAQTQGRSPMAAAMTGRQGPSYIRNLTLQLGSPRAASGTPAAEHLPPATLNASPSLPLVSPEPARAPALTTHVPGTGDGGGQGRILIYWGCGERARQGQPVEIDLARLSRGQAQATLAGLNIRYMTPPNASTASTYGEWPNPRSRTQIPTNGSLVGDHVIRGNYSPEIRFSLTQGQDFLAPVNITANSRAASGAVPVAWQAVPNARAYFMMASGARADGTIVIWTSSEIQMSQMSLDYLAPEEIVRLLQQRVLLQPATTQCTVPAEVAGSVEAASLMLTAFGPEANFSYPARPAAAPRGWAPEWTAKLRTRSVHMGMLGQNMEAMMRGRSAEAPQREEPQRRTRRNPLGALNPLGRLLGN